jgi:tRNA(Ile)-lysidine synthase
MTEISLRDPVPLLVRSADVLRDDNDLLEELARNLDPTDAVALAAAPAPRALRQWLSDPYPPDLATLDRIMAVARGETLACDIGENREIRRSKQRLILQLLG